MARSIRNVPDRLAVRVPPLVLQIADRLERDIIAGRYACGAWLREQDIADRLGTSRGPVREALRLLELDGFAEVVPWRGTRVVAMTPDELDDLMEVVASLQGLVARLAAIHAEPAAFDPLAGMIDEMEATLARPDAMGRQLALAFEAGAMLREICTSDRAGGMLMRVGRLAYWQHRFLMEANLRWRKAAVLKWRVLLAALYAGDGDRADRAARAMVHQSKQLIGKAARRTAHARSMGSDPAVEPEELPARMQMADRR